MSIVIQTRIKRGKEKRRETEIERGIEIETGKAEVETKMVTEIYLRKVLCNEWV